MMLGSYPLAESSHGRTADSEMGALSLLTPPLSVRPADEDIHSTKSNVRKTISYSDRFHTNSTSASPSHGTATAPVLHSLFFLPDHYELRRDPKWRKKIWALAENHEAPLEAILFVLPWNLGRHCAYVQDL